MSIDLKKHFDKVYVVNLDSRPDKWDAFKDRAKKAGVVGFDRFRAVDGHLCNPPAWYNHHGSDMNGAWGCLMSHFMIAYDAMQSGVDTYLVLEDDACFSSDFKERLPDVLAETNKLKDGWDMLYLGGQHLYKETRSPDKIEGTDLLKCVNVNRTHAFAVHSRFMLKFSQHIMHAPDYIDHRYYHNFLRHVDHQLGELHDHMQTIAPINWLCGQAEGSSDVNGQEKPQEWWHSKGW